VRARRFYRAPKDEAHEAEQDKKTDPKPEK
jgi:hypothetical protein